MLRRFAFLAFAVAATLQTGCHGRVCAFFYRLTHCGCCSPYYGDGGCCAPCAAPCYNGPAYGGQPCCASPVAGPPMAGQPVFTAPQPMPTTGPTVVPSSPMGEPKKN